MVLNSYTAPTGGDTIIQLSATLKNTANVSGITLYLLNDPNNDAQPDDLILLQSIALPSAIDGLNTVSITPTLVTGTFFVAASFIDPVGDTNYGVFATDTDSNLGQSWFSAHSELGTIDPENLPAFTRNLLDNPTIFSTGGNFLLTATSIPEPSSTLLVGLGAGSLLLRRRRNA